MSSADEHEEDGRRTGTALPAGATATDYPPGFPERYRGMVEALAWVAHQQCDRRVPVEDLAAYGLLGLVEAAERFDPTRGVKFTTFAYPRVRGAILDGLAEMAPLLERSVAPADLDAQAGPPPSAEAASPPARLAAAEARARVAMLAGRLPEQMREVLHLVYVSGHTLTSAGDRMSLSTSRASRVHRQALEQLAGLLRRDGVLDDPSPPG